MTTFALEPLVRLGISDHGRTGLVLKFLKWCGEAQVFSQFTLASTPTTYDALFTAEDGARARTALIFLGAKDESR